MLDKVYVQIPIFYSAGIDLESIQLDFLNSKFIKIVDLKDYTQQFDSGHSTTEDSINHHSERFDIDFLYALVPIDITTKNTPNIFNDINCIFLLLYPSDFTICSIIEYDVYDDGKRSVFLGEMTWGGIQNGSHRKILLDYKTSDKQLIEDFIKLFFASKNNFPNYLDLCIRNYINHYFIWHDNLSFISLCISMETIVEGKEQLSYRIRRNFALLNGSTVEECRLIEKNVQKIYELRSKLVHGETSKTYEELQPNFNYLRSLISFAIIELINTGSIDRITLNQKINELGYGDKYKLCSTYDPKYQNRFNRIKSIVIH